MPKKKTNEEFTEELNKVNPNIELLEEYKGIDTKIKFKCKICGSVFIKTPYSIVKRKQGCKECSRNNMRIKMSKTNKQFLEELKQTNLNIKPIEEYKGTDTKIKFKCLDCGNIWETTPYSILRAKYGCPKCACKLNRENVKYTDEEFKDILKIVNGNIEVLDEYKNIRTKIKFKCKVCNNEWYALPDNVLNLRQSCPKCAGNTLKTQDEFLNEVEEINPDIEVLGKYINTKTKIKIKCKTCGNVWEVIPANILYNKSIICRNCVPNGSLMEIDLANNINNILNNLDEKSEEPLLYRNRKFEDLRNPNYKLELDIYIPEYNLGIEFDGLHWHSEEILKNKKTQLQKREFFEKNYNIRVIFVREDEWVNNKDIVLSRIKNILHIKEENDKTLYARNLIIGEDIRTNIKDIFLDRYHIQGKDIATLKYGLYTKDGKLVSVMTFVKNRMIGKIDNEKRIIELSRFASRTNINVVGGFSKLLKYAEKQLKELGYELIKTYADRRWSSDTNNVYIKNGFTLTGITEPNYVYFKGNTIYSRQSFQKKKLKEKFPEVYEDELTEFEIANLAGYNRYYDCGNLVYYKEIAKP